MKTLLRISLFILSLVFTLSSCMDETFDKPELVKPVYSGTKTFTIKQLKALCTSSLVQISDTDSVQVVISGIVIGNDESGNIYKGLHIQDETAGIEIKLDKVSLYNTYKVGQRVFVKCDGMYLGTYGGVIQLGDIYNGAIGRMADIKIKNHLFLDDFPYASNIPTADTISTFSQLHDSLLNTLVVLKDGSFADAGLIFAEAPPASNTSRNINISGGSVIAYNSAYANFQADILPKGKGYITGVLSKYNSDYQLLIRSRNDIGTFVEPILGESFGNSFGTFTTQSVTGDQVWGIDGTYKCAKMTGYYNFTNYANEDWLISPSLNFSSLTSAKLSFDHAKFSGSNNADFTLWISTDYVSGLPSTGTWTQITIPTYPANYTFVNSGLLDLASYLTQSNVHIAFKYISTTSAGTWEIKNVLIDK